MEKEQKLRFLKILLENEPLKKSSSVFKFGVSAKTAKRIFNFFSIKLIKNSTLIERHDDKEYIFFRIKSDFLFQNKFHTYILTIQIKRQSENLKIFMKEYFYLKLIFHILLKENHLTTSEIINLL